MKKNLLLLLTMICVFKISIAQITFQKTITGVDNKIYSGQQTADGGYIVTGYIYPTGQSLDVILIKTDANGTTLWAKLYGGSGIDEGWAVQQTTDGGYIIAGETGSFNTSGYDVYLIKTDANGDTLWTKTFGEPQDDFAYSVQQTTDGGYIIAGSTQDSNLDIYAYLIKTDANGTTLWTKTFSSSEGFFVRQTTDGGYIITGANFISANEEVLLMKTDATGNILWSKYFGGTGADRGYSVKQTSDGGYIIAGLTGGFGAGSSDVYLVKTDASGNLLWSRTMGGSSWDQATSVQQTTDGGYIVAGFTESFGSGPRDAYLIKTDSNGDTLWTKTYGGTNYDEAYYVQQTTDGGYMMTGTVGLTNIIYLIKTDANGNSGCNQGSAATIVTIPSTQSANTSPVVATPPTVTTDPATVVLSGAAPTATICFNVGIEELTNNTFLISPNPFTSEISITLPKQNLNQATITIKNILGQTVFIEQENNLSNSYTKTIDLSFLSKGVYVCSVYGKNVNKQFKIIKAL